MFQKVALLQKGLINSSKMNFCIYKAYLNPEKHISMSHNVNNMYEDIVGVGENITPNGTNDRVQSKVYEQQVINLVFNYLNAKYPNAKLNASNYKDIQADTWSKYGIDINAEKEDLLELLSQKIFVKDNKYRYLIEQRNRLASTQKLYSHFNLNDYMIFFFVDSYAQLIRINAERSNLWQSPQVKGDQSGLEKYISDYQDDSTGVSALRRDIPQNQTFINRMLARIHSL